MPRGVLVVNAMKFGDKSINTCTIGEAFGANVLRKQFVIECDPTDVFESLRATPPQVRPAGEKLYNALVAAEAGRDFFSKQVAQAPVFIQVDAPEIEELPWETLWELQRDFMALDPQGRWPIGRLASATQPPQPLKRFMSQKLRVAVVIAAAGEKGAEEWKSIAEALNGIVTPLHVLALVSEAEAKAAVAADAAAWAGQGLDRAVDVDFVGDSDTALNRLRRHLPNIVHFFCHGIADVRPQLELETRADRISRKTRGSITLDSKMLVDLADTRSLWLIVLNCCQGAKAAPQLHSLARDLVTAGAPAVVAMRESVDVRDANLFSQQFYTALFPQLHAAFALRNNPQIPKPLPLSESVWLKAIDPARRRLSLAPRVAASSVEWTYPVVYVHRDPLELHPRDLKPLPPQERLTLVTELGVLRPLRDTLNTTTGPDETAKRTALDTRIAEIEAHLASG